MRAFTFLAPLLALASSVVAAPGGAAQLREMVDNMPGLAAEMGIDPAKFDPKVFNPPDDFFPTTTAIPEGEVHDFEKRATTTSCACYGYKYQDTRYWNNAYIELLHGTGTGRTNPTGWCFQNGVMMSAWSQQITAALTSNTNNNYANGTWIKTWCQSGCLQTATSTVCNTNSGCVNTLGTVFYNALNAGNYFAACTWPTANFAGPIDCNCNFACTTGYVACGRSCINPLTQKCVSGVPANKRSWEEQLALDTQDANVGASLDGNEVKVNLPKRRWPKCEEPGFERCAVHRGGSECLDTSSHLEACGGCPINPDGEPGDGIDCSDLPGVDVVQCRSGKCHIQSCDKRYSLLNGTCVPRFGRRAAF